MEQALGRCLRGTVFTFGTLVVTPPLRTAVSQCHVLCSELEGEEQHVRDYIRQQLQDEGAQMVSCAEASHVIATRLDARKLPSPLVLAAWRVGRMGGGWAG